MALVSLRQPFIFAPITSDLGAVGTASTFTFDAASDGIAVVFRSPATALDKVSFRSETYTSTGTLECSIQTVDTSGLPTGTVVGSTPTVSITSGPTNWEVTGLAATGLSLTTQYAIVIQAQAGFAGNFTLRSTGEGSVVPPDVHPYMLTKNGAGAWTKTSFAGFGGAVGIGDTSRYYMLPYMLGGHDIGTGTAVTSTSDPREVGCIFQIPFKARLSGVVAYHNRAGASADSSFHLYSTPLGTPVEQLTISIDDDQERTGTGWRYYNFGSTYEISINTNYVIAIQSAGSNGVGLTELTCESNAVLDCFFDKNVYKAYRATTGSTTFSTTDTVCPFIFPVFDQMDDGASAGGGLSAIGYAQ